MDRSVACEPIFKLGYQDRRFSLLFFFNDTATTEIYTLSLHDALPIYAHIPLSAILLIVVASACFSAVDVTVKQLSQRYPVLLLVWARWGVQALVLLALMGPRMRKQ